MHEKKEMESSMVLHGLRTYHKRSIFIGFISIVLVLILLMVRLGVVMIGESEHYGKAARDVQERERPIKAERGRIFDCNGVELASNKSVCTISVIHSQIREKEKVIETLKKELELSDEYVRKRVEKVSSMERIATNVEKKTADKIRNYHLDGVMVDEDFKRYYPYGSLASKVIGFTGSDNQGIIGLEVKYEKYLKGENGKILTLTNARGIEIKNQAERRCEPISGKDLYLSLDVTIQKYTQQIAKQVRAEKQAKSVKVILINPQNGEIYAMVNEPEFDLNDPFTLAEEEDKGTEKEKNKKRNEMWRNGCISDTYEPGSTFKIITATAALSENAVKVEDSFFCPGYRIVEDRRIRCHKTIGHGAETFREGIMNSCNPVFMDIAARTGVDSMYKWYKRLGLMERTGIDAPGEANSIFHQKENVGEVELATMAFGQSIQITPLQLLRAVCSVVNGGKLVTPHFGVRIENRDKTYVKKLGYETEDHAVDEEVSETMRTLLEAVVSEGGGKNAYIEGYHIEEKPQLRKNCHEAAKSTSLPFWDLHLWNNQRC